MVSSISFQSFWYRHLKLSLENSVCYCYTSSEMTDQFFIISGSNEQLQQELEYTLLKLDCQSWWISKMQSGQEDMLEERYAIKFCQKLWKNTTETYGMLLEHLAWIDHQFLSGIRDSRKAGSLWGVMRGVGGVKKSIHQSLLAKGLKLRLGLLC